MRFFLIIFLIFQLAVPLIAKEDVLENCTFSIKDLRQLPVQHQGRVKPLDTVARYSLLILHGSQSLKSKGKTIQPIEWLVDVLMNSDKAKNLKLIRIENSDLLGMIGENPKIRNYYSIVDLEPYFNSIYSQFSKAIMIDKKHQDHFQQAVVVLWHQIVTYLSLSNTLWIAGNKTPSHEILVFNWEIIKKNLENNEKSEVELPFTSEYRNRLEWFKKRYQYLSDSAHFKVLFPRDNDGDQTKWYNLGEGLLARFHEESLHPGIILYAELMTAYQKNDASLFNKTLKDFLNIIKSQSSKLRLKINFELLYNDFQPFFVSSIIYLLVFILSLLSSIVWPQTLKKISFFLLLLGFIIHSFGLVSRMIIEGRPPVTNLYSSAIFVGWATVFFSLFVERFFRNCIGCIVGSSVGALTLIVAQHLSANGDTMNILRAVLDSNFWLSTHVVTITLGYSATFLAGSLGCLFIISGILTRSLDLKTSNKLSNMVYGIICFATLLSFLGTVLGGIWADQSWGRFWGWDPKENGALLVILWNVMILHAKVGGVIKKRGLMVMAVFGNLITSFSWFGVNMLGIGLHSYGFMDGAFLAFAIFFLTQFTIICLGGLLPRQYWRSKVPGL
ncbi:MAG: Cytochrome c biogenesis protein CcsA [Chlamydiae bacterium]|nr:Cytochrome c biogenesis protein CcsA [Chlamydiota bacterium]